MRKRTFVGVLVFWLVCLLLPLVLATPSVHAAAKAQLVVHARGNGPHCVMKIAPIKPGQASSDILSASCYKTVSQAAFAATDGRLRLPANATLQDEARAYKLLEKASPNAVNLISIWYQDIGYGGNSLRITTTGPQCSSSISYGNAVMPTVNGFNWNNQLSSIDGGYYNCQWIRIWDNPYYGGTNLCINFGTSYVGDAMNDRTSSIYWRQSGPDPCQS